MNLVLGTAQLGLNYGITNKTGQPNDNMACDIIRVAWDAGIREFDTAQAYGKSEALLGIAIKKFDLSGEIRVITKLDPSLDHLDEKKIKRALENSLTCLGIPKIYGLMLHREEMMVLWGKGLSGILKNFVLSGKIKMIGVSVYTPESAKIALRTSGIDMVQIPTNILDQRFEKAGIFDLAEETGKQLYIRSVFLQGLILMQPADLGKKMMFAVEALKNVEKVANELSVGRQHLALGYLRSKFPKANIIFGAETADQVKENIAMWNRALPVSVTSKIEDVFKAVDNRIVNPALWPANEG